MRLGQLSRKLSVRTSDIIEFLSTNNIQIENDSNARVDDEHVSLIMHHFSPGLVEEAGVVSSEPEIPEQPSEENSILLPESVEAPLVDVSPLEEIPNPVIKAPKVELSGLKILGKIDLPERKKKESTAEINESAETGANTKGQKRPNRRERHDPERNVNRKNSVALQREQEALQAEKQRQERAVKQKEQRTQNYLKRVKTAAPTKSARLMQEPTEELSKIEDKPTTLFGRFLHWLKK